MKRVLVTGGTGFIGRQVLPILVERGYEVHAGYTRKPGPQVDGVEWHEMDLLDIRAVEMVEEIAASHLLHLAWYAEWGDFWVSERNLAWVEASLRLLRAFHAGAGQRVAIAGSCAEYDWFDSRWDGICREDRTPLRPNTLYGACKDSLRRVAERWGSQFGVSLTWGRIFFVYGPGEDPRRLIPSVASALVRGEAAPVTAGEQRRDFLHSADVARSFAALLDSRVEGPVNIGSGTAKPVREIVELVATAAGRPDLVEYGAIETRPGDPPVLQADTSRLREEVGFTPELTLEQGIERVVEELKAEV
jgi:nucleoside-diphosphate-sugar epimerase